LQTGLTASDGVDLIARIGAQTDEGLGSCTHELLRNQFTYNTIHSHDFHIYVVVLHYILPERNVLGKFTVPETIENSLSRLYWWPEVSTIGEVHVLWMSVGPVRSADRKVDLGKFLATVLAVSSRRRDGDWRYAFSNIAKKKSVACSLRL
jgi:hypothetical protein